MADAGVGEAAASEGAKGAADTIAATAPEATATTGAGIGATTAVPQLGMGSAVSGIGTSALAPEVAAASLAPSYAADAFATAAEMGGGNSVMDYLTNTAENTLTSKALNKVDPGLGTAYSYGNMANGLANDFSSASPQTTQAITDTTASGGATTGGGIAPTGASGSPFSYDSTAPTSSVGSNTGLSQMGSNTGVNGIDTSTVSSAQGAAADVSAPTPSGTPEGALSNTATTTSDFSENGLKPTDTNQVGLQPTTTNSGNGLNFNNTGYNNSLNMNANYPEAGSSAGDASLAPGSSNTPTTTTPSFVDKALSTLSKNAVPIGLMAANQLMNSGKKSAGLNQAQTQANTENNIAADQYAQYQAGVIPPATEYQISQWEQQQIAAVRDYYAKAGLSDSAMAQSAESQIMDQGNAKRQAALQQELTNATSTYQIANGPVNNAVNAQISSDQKASDAQSQFLAALAKMSSGA